MGQVDTCRILVGKHEGKSPLAKNIRKQDGNMKMDSTKIRWDEADWIYVAQDRENWGVCVCVNMVMKLRVPQNAGDFLTG
jgi:hypothetical protein